MRTGVCIVLLLTLVGCNKTVQEKKLEKWEGTWEIQEVETGEPNSFSKSNPFGTIEVSKTGKGTMYIKNFDYTDVDMGLKIDFYLNAFSNGSLQLLGLFVLETNPGYEYLKTELPCEDNHVDILVEGDAFSNRTCAWSFANFPPCLFTNNEDIVKRYKWHLKKVD